MNIKEFKNRHKDKLVILYYTEYKTVDVMDETLCLNKLYRNYI